VKGLEGAVEVQRVAKSVDQMQLEEEEGEEGEGGEEEQEQEEQEEEEEEEEEEEGCHDWARTGPVLAEIRAEMASFQEMSSETLEGFVGAPPPELDVRLAEHGADILQCLRYSVSLHIYIIFTLNNSLKLALP
jgi:hypothetical protein